MNPLIPLLDWIDLFGIAVFAASGALAAARREQTIVTFAFFALVTGVGGGTVRDLLIEAPVFWVRDARVAAVCLATAFVIWMTPRRWWSAGALDWFDAVGLAAYAVFGAAKAMAGTANFLKEQGRVQEVKPDYSAFITTVYVQKAMGT